MEGPRIAEGCHAGWLGFGVVLIPVPVKTVPLSRLRGSVIMEEPQIAGGVGLSRHIEYVAAR